MKIIDLSVKFLLGGAENSVAIQWNSGEPKMNPKFENAVKIEGKVKKVEFLKMC